MKLSTNDICPRYDLHITGDEPWLARLYADFPVTTGPAPKLTADLHFLAEEGDSIRATGRVRYAPMVGCSRCDHPIPRSIDAPVDVRFYPEGVNEQPREKNLSRADLDAYYIQDYSLDIEELINDTVQTALPTTILDTNESDGLCKTCQAEVAAGEAIGGQEAAKPTSPFAVLKGLKLPN